MNWVDLIIILVTALFVWAGYMRGFVRDLADLLALVVAIWLATISFSAVGNWIGSVLPLPDGFASTVGFFFVWFIILFIYYILMIFFYDMLPENIRSSKYNRWFGPVPAALRGLLFVWFTVNLVFLLVIAGPIKQTLEHSFFSRQLLKSNSVVNSFVTKTFGSAVVDTVNFLTVKPQSGETVQLGFTTTDVKPDTTSAQKMLDLVNKERVANNLKPLVMDNKLTQVGEAHCRDMFARGYFSHNTPEGKTPFDRMDAAGVIYLIAGENLALAPTADDAFAGLMNSPRHRANMLSADFGKIGIGVIDGGVHGKMFAQEFTN